MRAAHNPGLSLGATLAACAQAGRDKLTLVADGRVASFGSWIEQLIAESTGKEGKGLIPVDGETIGEVSAYGNDRFFIDLRTANESDDAHEAALIALEKAGHPVVRIVIQSVDHLGQEFFRFELATAVAGAILGINPFNQPDVEAAKIAARTLTVAYEEKGSLPPAMRLCTSAVMNTVLPAFERPVTPSRSVGLNKCAPNSARACVASRICSKSSATQRLLHGCVKAAAFSALTTASKAI